MPILCRNHVGHHAYLGSQPHDVRRSHGWIDQGSEAPVTAASNALDREDSLNWIGGPGQTGHRAVTVNPFDKGGGGTGSSSVQLAL